LAASAAEEMVLATTRPLDLQQMAKLTLAAAVEEILPLADLVL
jgi:hypothetical protein